MRTTAGAYLRNGIDYVFSEARTTIGWRIYSGAPPACLAVSVSDAELGTAIRAAGAQYRVDVEQPHPRDVDDVDGQMFPFLRASGVKSWKAFVMSGGTRLANIAIEDDVVRISPTQRRGIGFVGRGDDAAIVATAPPDADLGAMLRECFARCG
ncbi:hypothetical protein [Sandaracinus amylolyticus]|uniref:hypothetical protein n=1 Tax=Sandaracinus amylolyticus TaxID=927083 RepID=UPI001F43E6FD|nr:hypothetical protein [Sandaracinus amylolyticus]UJR80327.1 Hypothetical protein I5071_23730 [Sandaracinus amylolyticus]